jgi:cold shock CspA family protein
MEQQVQVTFQDIEPSDSVESLIREKVAKLEEFHGRIISCRVAVSQPRARGRNGHLHKVRIDLTIPGGKEIVVSRDPGVDHSHENVLVAVRDAFDAASRQLDEYVERRNPSATKRHTVPPHGRITQIFHTKDHGFIRSAAGEDVYFHRNAVTDGSFDELTVGAEVRFAVADVVESANGPQATSVTPLGKKHMVDSPATPRAG